MPVEGANLLTLLSLHFLKGLITHKFAYMLDSLVRVSRRVKFEILINSYFLLAMSNECEHTWRRFDTNVDLEFLPSINERWVNFRQYATLLWSPRWTDIAYILIAGHWGGPEDVSSIKSFLSQFYSYEIQDASCSIIRRKYNQSDNLLLSPCDKLISCVV